MFLSLFPFVCVNSKDMIKDWVGFGLVWSASGCMSAARPVRCVCLSPRPVWFGLGVRLRVTCSSLPLLMDHQSPCLRNLNPLLPLIIAFLPPPLQPIPTPFLFPHFFHFFSIQPSPTYTFFFSFSFLHMDTIHSNIPKQINEADKII